MKEQLGDLDAALAEAEKAFAAGEEDPSASTCLATLHYKKGCAVEGRRKVYREDQRKDRKAASIAKEQSATEITALQRGDRRGPQTFSGRQIYW